MKLYVTRHGQTDWNEQGRIQGKIDIPLNEQGRAQARKTRDLLAHTPFDVIITSPLQRAVETATIINEAHGVKQYEDERLSERGFGTWEGASISEVDFTCFWDARYEDHFPACERTTLFYQRVHAFINELRQSERKHVLIVAHGGVSLPFYTYFHPCPTDGDMRKYMLNNCEVASYEL